MIGRWSSPDELELPPPMPSPSRGGWARSFGPASPPELFCLVGLALLMASMQFAMISVAVPDVVRDLDSSLRWVSWTISLFTVTQAVSFPLLGKLSDAIGRRAVFVTGVAVFGASSMACAVAPNVALLILFRGIQGMAAGSLLPSAYGIVGDVFAGAGRARMLGLISSVFPIGAIVGPNLGGFLVDHFSWRVTFLVNVPIAALLVLWSTVRLRGVTRRPERGEVDYLGAVLLTASAGGLMFALSELGRSDGGTSAAVMATSMGLAVSGGALLVVRSRRIPHPLVDLALLRRREFAFLNALNFLYGMCIFGMVGFVPLYAQVGYGFTATQAGLLLTPRALAMIGTSILGSMLLHRTGFRFPIRFGLLVLVVSAGLLGGGHAVGARSGLSEPVYLTIVVALLGIGLGFAGPSVNQSGLDLLPDQVAAITGLRGMFRALGGAIGTVLIATVASRSSTQAVGLELSFLAIATIAVAALGLIGGIPNRPGGRAHGDDRASGTVAEEVTVPGEGSRTGPVTASVSVSSATCPNARSA